MLAAEKAGKSPEAFVAEVSAARKQYLDGFHISFDNWHSTHSAENVELSQDIYRKLKAAGFILIVATNQPDVGRGRRELRVVPDPHALQSRG